jgi:hypothetical protein
MASGQATSTIVVGVGTDGAFDYQAEPAIGQEERAHA